MSEKNKNFQMMRRTKNISSLLEDKNIFFRGGYFIPEAIRPETAGPLTTQLTEYE
jgi:hypothetical protein